MRSKLCSQGIAKGKMSVHAEELRHVELFHVNI